MSDYKNLFEFLQVHKTKDKNSITHTRIGDKSLNIYGGSYSIPDTELSVFYKLYNNHVFVKKQPEYLTEVQRKTDNVPLLVDFDFRYEPSVKERLHDIEHIVGLCEIYTEAIMDTFEIDDNVSIPTYIFEKPNVNTTDTKQTKDGIHIMFGIHADHTHQNMIRAHVLKNINRVLDDLPLTNTYEDVLDEGIMKGTTNWQLYGSKKPGNEAYQLKKKFNINATHDGEISLDEETIKSIRSTTILSNATARKAKLIHLDLQESQKETYENLKMKKKKKIRVVRNISTNNMILNTDILQTNFALIQNEEQLDYMIETWLNQLPQERYLIRETHDYTLCLPTDYYGPGSYNKWIRVGWALANTDNNMFLTWLKMSSQNGCRMSLRGPDGKFDWDHVGELYEMWTDFMNSSSEDINVLTYRSIMYWCKNDNHEGYTQIRNNTITYYLELNKECIQHHDVATLVYHYYKDKYRCASTKKGGLWYEFKDHRWVEIEGGSSLRMNISIEISRLYADKSVSYMKQSMVFDHRDNIEHTNPEDDIKKQKLVDLSNQFGSIFKHLRDSNYKRNIMSEVADIFYENDRNFLKNIDKNTNLLGFRNGVYDFKNNEFRPGLPEDYITKSTNINYVPIDRTNKKHTDKMNEINDFMCKLFPDDNLRRYMWEHLASTLIGKNHNQTFNIYNGCGRNGKSKLVELMSLVLGEYKSTIPTSVVTSKRGGVGQLSGEIAQLQGVRYAVMQEPSKDDQLNDGVMKELTGEDPIMANPKYKDPVIFIPQFKLVVCTNNLFDIKSDDDGTWRRIRLCEFESKFDSKLKPTPESPYVFEPDLNLDKKFETWKEIFMSMLVEKAVETGGIVKDCDRVLEASNKYRQDQDYLLQFFTEMIAEGDSTDSLKITAVKSEFKDWYIRNYNTKPPKAKELEEFLNKKIGPRNRSRGWVGYKIVYDEPDCDDDEFNDGT